MSTQQIKIAIAGAGGRMGREIITAARRDSALEIVAAIEHSGSEAVGKDTGEIAGGGSLGVKVRAELECDFDVLIEFTTPVATLQHLNFCRKHNRAMLIGTTGFSDAERKTIAAAGAEIPLLLAANTSLGVNICDALAAAATKMLNATAALDAFDIEIVEAHHRHKVDAPSGTALMLGETIAAAAGKNLTADAVFSRGGTTTARAPGSIGFASVRGGDVAGEHSVMFIGNGERVEITHRATDRKIFAAGALRAATWLTQQSPGQYSMRDVLGLAGN